MNDLTIAEVAALLTERGHTDRKGGPVKLDTVKHQVARGVYPNARLRKQPGMGRGLWLIPLSDVEAYLVAQLASVSKNVAARGVIEH